MIRRIAVLVFLTFNLYKAQENRDNSHTAAVYFVRSTGANGTLVKWPVFMDDSLVCSISNNKYLKMYLAPGAHKFQARFRKSDSSSHKRLGEITLEMKGDHIYYIQVNLTAGIVFNRLNCYEITETTFDQLKDKLKQQIE
jgi:hypothetical protein